MAWCWAFLVLLAFGVNGEDFCARKGATSASSFCHPDRMNAYIECKQGRDVVSTCPDGLSWSLKIRTCVNRMLSECAASFERKTKKAPASLCDTPPALETGCAYSYRCHPDDASQFVICPPNIVYATIGRCPENRLFSLSDEKCIAGRTTDCARALDGPEAGNIERASDGTPVSVTSFLEIANTTMNAANNTSDADLGAANVTAGNIATVGLASGNQTISAAKNVPVPLKGAEYFATSVMGPISGVFGPQSAFKRGEKPWRSLPGAGFPQTVHVRLPLRVVVSGFSFRSPRMGGYNSPTKFDFVGSDDCKSWTVILQVSGAQWNPDLFGDEKKSWYVPIKQQGSYRCYGFRVHATQFNFNVEIADAKLWREKGLVDVLTSHLNEIRADMVDFKSTLEAKIQRQLGNITTQLENIDIKSLSARISAMSDLKSTLDAKMDSLGSTVKLVNSHASSINSLASTIKSLTERISATESGVKAAEANSTVRASSIESLSGRISTIESRDVACKIGSVGFGTIAADQTEIRTVNFSGFRTAPKVVQAMRDYNNGGAMDLDTWVSDVTTTSAKIHAKLYSGASIGELNMAWIACPN